MLPALQNVGLLQAGAAAAFRLRAILVHVTGGRHQVIHPLVPLILGVQRAMPDGRIAPPVGRTVLMFVVDVVRGWLAGVMFCLRFGFGGFVVVLIDGAHVCVLFNQFGDVHFDVDTVDIIQKYGSSFETRAGRITHSGTAYSLFLVAIGGDGLQAGGI